MQKFMLSASQNCTRKAYILKGDLSGYFMSLKRETLYSKVVQGLKRQFPEGGWLYELCEYLWREVIFDDPCIKARLAGDKSGWDCLPRSKTLFYQPPGQGIVIGNLTSQLLSNVMLNEFDWSVKKRLKFERYGRYVDDFFIVVEAIEYERARVAMKHEVPEYLRKMGLTMHPKKLYIQEVSHGCPFLGKMVRPFVLTPGKRYLKNMRRAFRGYLDGQVSFETVQSYIGMGAHMAAFSAMRKSVGGVDDVVFLSFEGSLFFLGGWPRSMGRGTRNLVARSYCSDSRQRTLNPFLRLLLLAELTLPELKLRL